MEKADSKNRIQSKTKPEKSDEARAQGYKTFFMLKSAEHENLNAHKHKNMLR